MDQTALHPPATFAAGYRPASLLAVGTDALALADIADAARALGLLIETRRLDAAALDGMAAAPSAVTVVLALGDEPGEADENACTLLRERAGRGLSALVVAPLAAIDRVAGMLDEPGIALLCQPSPLDLATALALAVAPAPARLHDSGKGHALYPQLQQLSEQMSQLARALAQISDEGDGAASAPSPSVAAQALSYRAERWPAAERPPAAPGEVDAAYVRSIIRGRRLRDSYFAPDLFADPAWDMLLDLTAARLERRDVAVSSLCIAAAVPPTTALRWIKTLTDAGTFRRVADPQDGRRVFITLADDAAEAMLNYLAAARRMASPVA